MSTRTLALMPLVAVIAVGCAGRIDVGGPPQAGWATATAAPMPMPMPLPPDIVPVPTEVPPEDVEPVEPRPGMADTHPVPWDQATIDRDALTVTLTYWSGVEPCSVLDRVDVVYGANVVTITLFEGSDPAAGDVGCIAIAQQKQVTVALEEDVGRRSLVDGAD